MAPNIQLYKVSVSDEALETLKNKLDSAIFPPEVDFSDDWAYGAPLSDIRRLTKYWAHGFDWRAQEAKLNKLPQYTTKVTVDNFGELDIHFLHQRSNKPASIPLLFVHGCEYTLPLSLDALSLTSPKGLGAS